MGERESMGERGYRAQYSGLTFNAKCPTIWLLVRTKCDATIMRSLTAGSSDLTFL